MASHGRLQTYQLALYKQCGYMNLRYFTEMFAQIAIAIPCGNDSTEELNSRQNGSRQNGSRYNDTYRCAANASEYVLDQLPDDTDNADTPADGIAFYIIGVLMTLLFVAGFIENGFVLFSFCRQKKLRKLNNAFLIGLISCDFVLTCLSIPMVGLASFMKSWIYGHIGCLLYGFLVTWCGMTQIAILTIIALDRYAIIVHNSPVFSGSLTKAVCTLISCNVFGLFWAMGPLLGWSMYELEAIGVSCSVSWRLRDDVFVSYTMSLFTVGWFLPLVIIVFGYFNVIRLIYSERARKSGLRSKCVAANRERKVAMTVLLVTGAFLVSWTPYSAVSLLTAFRDVNTIPTSVILIPAIFAKCSIIWNPIIYLSRHRDFRDACRLSLPWTILQRNSTAQGRSKNSSKKGATSMRNGRRPGLQLNDNTPSDSSGHCSRTSPGTDAVQTGITTDVIELCDVPTQSTRLKRKDLLTTLLDPLKKSSKFSYVAVATAGVTMESVGVNTGDLEASPEQQRRNGRADI